MERFLDRYPGTIAGLGLGKEGKLLAVGGQNALPFHGFEGRAAKPRLALELSDREPVDYPAGLQELYAGVSSCPVAWAKQGAQELGAELLCLNLGSMEQDIPAPTIAAGVRRIAEAVDVPLIVFGLGDKEKDAAVLPVVAAECRGHNLLLGPVLKENYQQIAPAALEHGHAIIAQIPMDINLAKDLNIRLGKFFPLERVVIDPLSCAAGYGLEYAYSTMERIRLAAVVHDDKSLQCPIIARVGKEVWKTKEAMQDTPRGVLWEAATAFTLLLAGADLVTFRHPESLRQVKALVG
ncbi:MAG TPA: acetyl-CoA decarbonylase/synthase complex subunit delta [Clostridiales bacterium UBA8153]|nr:acetyl-CoA decarbonylase/synthase complex subunit delta [Clostridiales bacterium UBA8153]